MRQQRYKPVYQIRRGAASAMSYTREQRDVIACDAPNIAVNAFAGTGKTSTLVGYTEARPQMKFLYIVFSAALIAEAKRKFPPNVEVFTSHGLAYAALGSKYKHKLGNVKAKSVLPMLAARFSSGAMAHERYMFARAALSLVERYFASDVIAIDIPALPANREITFNTKPVRPQDLTEAARMIWAAMKDRDNLSIPMPHDGYLKLYQIAQPRLTGFGKILLDEAQDTNPATLHLLLAQPCGKLIVGDRHQSIFQFRGAVDAMNRIDGAEHLALTSSFRYGPRVADTANAVLHTFRGETKNIVGLGNDASPITSSCYIHRTNAALFARAVELHHAGKKLCFNGGVSGYQFDLLLDYQNLDAGRRDEIQSPFVRDFHSSQHALDYAKQTDDKEILAKLQLVDTYSERIPELVDELTRNAKDASQADYTLTTGHRAKGLEWDAVALGEDFPPLMGEGRPLAKPYTDDNEALTPLSTEEANLLYVSLTRPRKRLKRNVQLIQLMDWWSEKNGTPAPATGTPAASTSTAAAA